VKYIIEAQNDSEQYRIERRFSDIYDTHSKYPSFMVKGISPPSKHILQLDGTDSSFISLRKEEIQLYFDQLTKKTLIVTDPVFLNFSELSTHTSKDKLGTEQSVTEVRNSENTLHSLERTLHVNPILEINMSPQPELHTNSGPHPLVRYSPFGVSCPYPSCGEAQYEARHLLAHIVFYHKDDKTQFLCPICTLLGLQSSTNKKFSLTLHIPNKHPELALLEDPFYQEIDQSSTYGENPYGDYIAQILQQKDYSECPICLCEFEKGETSARLPCLCYYHQPCIEVWYSKSGKRVCPTHSEM